MAEAQSVPRSDLAAERGEPSYVWRSGQERRLDMMLAWSPLTGHVFDNGCGVGSYLNAFGRFTPHRFGLELEEERAGEAQAFANGVTVGVGEHLPYRASVFDAMLSNEVIEHVVDDRAALSEMVRVLKPGGRLFIFCPNRWYPVETHGIYWRGKYSFGNKWLVNYLPTPLRDRLAPHVKAYSQRALRDLYRDLPVRELHATRIFGGYDNIEHRWPKFGRFL